MPPLHRATDAQADQMGDISQRFSHLELHHPNASDQRSDTLHAGDESMVQSFSHLQLSHPNGVDPENYASTINDSDLPMADDTPPTEEPPIASALRTIQERRAVQDILASRGPLLLTSWIRDDIPPREGETRNHYARRYVEALRELVARGAIIVIDRRAEARASVFETPDGRLFDAFLTPRVPEGEFREFTRWIDEVSEAGGAGEVPERWLRFEVTRKREPDLIEGRT